MKKLVLFFSLMLMGITGVKAAKNLTPTQEKAQQSLIAFLQKGKYDPSIDTSDNTVCYRRGDVFYWITIEEESPLLYTIHRKPIKVGADGCEYTPALMAANEVNRKNGVVKLTVSEKKVDFAVQVYAATPEAFTSVYEKYSSLLTNIADNFKKAYVSTKAKIESEALKKEQEEINSAAPSVLKGNVVSVSFRVTGNQGEEISGYDKPIRSYNAHFIQAKMEFAPYKDNNPASFTIRLRITKPDGKVIYLPGKRYSAESTITMQKIKKDPNQVFELDEFGDTHDGFWKAGEYKVDFLESGSIFYTTTFNVL